MKFKVCLAKYVFVDAEDEYEAKDKALEGDTWYEEEVVIDVSLFED